MANLDNLQIDIKNQIEKSRINFKKTPKARLTISYLESRLESLEQEWSTFVENHSKIICEISRDLYEKSSYYKQDVYDITKECYLDYKSEMKEILVKLETNVEINKAKVNENNSDFTVKLPKITIPTFSGKYEEWTSFRDLFMSLVHNNKSLDDVQKLHYLKAHLCHEAEQLLRHIPITSANYNICWSQLDSRYNNKRHLSYNVLKRLLGQKSLTCESSSGIKELLDTTTECLNALNNLGIDVSTWDVIVIYIISLKLDTESRKLWESKVSDCNNVLPTYSQFKDFLKQRFQSLEFLDTNKSNKSIIFRNTSNPKSLHVTNDNCQFCSEGHRLFNCPKFCNADVVSRRNFVQMNRLCFNCFGANHTVYTCRQNTTCRICKKKHHSLLHPRAAPDSVGSSEVFIQPAESNVVNVATTSQDETVNLISCMSTNHNQVLLATALVKVQSSKSKSTYLRALLDQGSQASFVTEAAVQLLGLKKLPSKSLISGLGSDQGTSISSRWVVEIEIQSLQDPSFKVVVKAHVLSKLTTLLPERRIDLSSLQELPQFQLADPTFHTPNKIDLLLGAEVYSQILIDGLYKGPPGYPIAQNTKLGWILSGPISLNYGNNSASHTMAVVNFHVSKVNENELLKKFWELESDHMLTNNKKLLTPEEQRCEDIFSSTTTRDKTGRYVVRLPFRNATPKSCVGNLKDIATKRFYLLERRLMKNSQLRDHYSEVMREYLTLKHMERVPEAERDKSEAVYLPHHPVVRDDKLTTKLRIVFDASCCGTNGVSLNNDLMVGPTLQSDLRHTIMRWRQYPICLTSDIVKMYRQVMVSSNDIDFQRVLWREDPESALEHYRMSRVTFGTASAPFLAVRALHQIAYDEGDQFPHAKYRVLNDFYMDDLMTGCETVAEGVRVYEEMTELLLKGGFELQKWSSNCKELINKIKSKIGHKRLEFDITEVNKILGLGWNQNTDNFTYSVQLTNISTPVTKRKVISDIAKLFDPLGWLAPTIITAKIFIQRLWVSGIEWDQELPNSLYKQWKGYREDLSKLKGFKIARWSQTSCKDLRRELHGFCDASSDAFAAVVYLRVIKDNGEVYVSLVTSKTKVAPIKQVSIPRLELCGATLLSRLLAEVASTLGISKENVSAWTDSSVVLAWLSSHPSRWKTFIANRVSEILVTWDSAQWHHVSSKDNPADCASRGITADSLVQHRLWAEGPEWLWGSEINLKSYERRDTNLEEKKVKVHHMKTSTAEELAMWSKYSSLGKLCRIVAYCRRLLKFRRSSLNFNPWLSHDELQEALTVCIRHFQKLYFSTELQDLERGGSISKKSKLYTFTPFIDGNGVLRANGRLKNANMSHDMKHPILLPSKCHFTSLIIAEAHQRTLHGGPQLMLNYLRTKYWILDAKNQVKFHVRKCVNCVRHAAQTPSQLMGQLPSARVTPCRPFYQCGVDYAGPISIRVGKGRGHHAVKGYICLFVCLATRAIHLELVSDLTSEGFIACFKRFVARRGHCGDIWSDNGTNFVGAARELQQLFTSEKSSVVKEIAEWLGNNGTNWHFIPPHAPNFGGLWEAGVKSTKHHLKRIIGDNKLTFEEMSTVLSQIEACLNSRPLSKVSVDPVDPYPLTPGHFLIGEPIMLVPDINYENSKISTLRRWQFLQRLVQDFWRRWSSEYLSQFHQRYKWADLKEEPKIGDVVLVKEDGLPPSKWLYGIVTDKHPGLDKITRVVSLKCKNNVIKRPISKLCILPVTE